MSTQTLIQASFTTSSINLETATALTNAVRKACEQIGIDVAIAVTDTAGHLKAFQRTDKGSFLAVDVAIDKAWTASFGVTTHGWVKLLADPNMAQMAHRPRLVAAGGGYPIKLGSTLIGGIGISGGNYTQDQQACEIALRHLGFDVE